MSSTTPTNTGGSLMKAAGLMAVLLMVSKVAGLARDLIVAQQFGFSVLTDAYFAAFQLPQFSLILLGGLGGPFHTATVSVFTRLLETDASGQLRPSLQAKRLANTLCSLVFLVFSLLSLLTFFYATPIMRLILGPEASTTLVTMAGQQLKIMSPIITIGGLVGFLYGALNMLQVYVWPALSPVVMSLVMIIALFTLGGKVEGGALLAWASLVGAVLQLALQLPEFFKKGFSLRPRLSEWKSVPAQQWYQLLWPAMLGSTMGQLMIYVDMFFASSLPEGAWSAVVFSNRLIQLPLGVLQTALLVPLFPRLVEYIHKQEGAALRSLLVKGVGALWFISLPVLIVLGISPTPFIESLFAYGNFGAGDAALLSTALAWQSLQILPYFARDTVTRVFYAHQDSKTPMLIGALAIGMKALLNYILVVKLKMGVAGITASITLITLFNLILLSIVLKRRHSESWPVQELFATLWKLSVASLPVLGLVYASTKLAPLLGLQHPLAESSLILVLGVGVGGYLYLRLAQRLGLPWLVEALEPLLRKVPLLKRLL
jgi:putative peptidoglycan lipid II flippase